MGFDGVNATMIQLSSRDQSPQFSHRLVPGPWVLVRTLARQGIEDIGDRNDARL